MLEEPINVESKPNEIKKEVLLNEVSNMIKNNATNFEIQSGIEEIDLELGGKNSKSYFTGEITHGLGIGDVDIHVGVEVEDGEGLFELGKCQIFGDPSIFEKSPYEINIPKHSLGVMTYVQKGTFRIGIKLLENTKQNSIKVRWWACKTNDKESQQNKGIITGVKLFIQPSTATIEPRGQIQLTATIKGANQANVRWSVKEEDGGTINDNGVYTAPIKEGVYEVIAIYKDNNNIRESAYVVVKGK